MRFLFFYCLIDLMTIYYLFYIIIIIYYYFDYLKQTLKIIDILYSNFFNNYHKIIIMIDRVCKLHRR